VDLSFINKHTLYLPSTTTTTTPSSQDSGPSYWLLELDGGRLRTVGDENGDRTAPPPPPSSSSSSSSSVAVVEIQQGYDSTTFTHDPLVQAGFNAFGNLLRVRREESERERERERQEEGEIVLGGERRRRRRRTGFPVLVEEDEEGVAFDVDEDNIVEE